MAEPGALDYFYGTEAEQYTFYQIPKVLFTDPGFRRMTADAPFHSARPSTSELAQSH